MTDFFKLIRYKNLLIIVLTMYLMRWCVIAPFLDTINLEMQFSEVLFLLLVVSTVFIAAAGYAINDYFDIKTDLTNHPESVIVGNKISRRWAMAINNILNFIGVLLGFYIAYKISLINLGFIFLFASGGLWFYSALYKRQLIIGNLIVAIFSALVPLLAVLFEIPLLNKIITPNRPPIESTVVSVIFLYVAGYAIFAFLTTLSREIIKDIEDLEGDNLVGRNTIPAYFGIKTSKIIVIVLLVVTILLLSIIYINFFQDFASLVYIFLLIVIPTVVSIYKIIKAKNKVDYHFVSKLLKLIMLFGLLFSVMLWFILD